MMMDTLDGITAEDVRRLNMVLEKRELESIHEEMGQFVMETWAHTFYKHAKQNKIKVYNYPEELERYLIKRYQEYKQKDTRSKWSGYR